MALEIKVTPGSGVSIYRQVIDQLKGRIAGGYLQPGEQLPSVRGLAEKLLINPNTVIRAYSELVREGLAEARQGSGYFVAERRQIYALEERRRRLQQAVEQFHLQVAYLDLKREEIFRALEKKFQDKGGGA